MRAEKRSVIAILLLAAVTGALCPVPLCAKMQLHNLFSLEMVGGGSYLNNSLDSFDGNLIIDWMPALKFNTDFSLIPHYYGIYSANRNLSELEGGSILYQETQNHRLSLKTVYRLQENMGLKTSAFYSGELTRETTNQNWWEGLYNYNQGGIDIEIKMNFPHLESPLNILSGYSFYMNLFPNYVSLASTEYGQELVGGKAIIGERAFDYNANELYFNFDIQAWPRGIYESSYTFTRHDYSDQKVVNNQSNYTDTRRTDFLHHLTLSLKYFFPRFSPDKNIAMSPSLIPSFEFDFLHSNQNYYDVDELLFMPSFYTYFQQKMCIPLTLKFYEPFVFNLYVSYSYALKTYISRTARAADGSYYSGQRLQKRISEISVNFIYPLNDNFSVVASAGFVGSRSNTLYEKVYLYNYDAWNYLVGINYAN